MTEELAHVADILAAAEERLAASPNDLNAKATVAALRSRLARIQSRTPPSMAPTPIPAALPQPAPTIAAAPMARTTKELAPTTEEERISRLTALATAMGADDKMIAAAIEDGITPDQFAVRVADKRIEAQEVEAVAQRILAAAAEARPNDDAGRVAKRIAAA